MTRTLGGLAPKAQQPQGNSRLIRKNRPTPSVAADPMPTPHQSPEVTEPRPPVEPSTVRLTETTTVARPSGATTKVGFYIDVDDAARLRGAARFIPDELRAAGINGFSALAAKLIMDGLAEHERTYNHGAPWPSLAPGEELPRGRRVR